MAKTSQRKAIENYRRRLGERGLTRFEVLGAEDDRELLRKLARALAEPGAEALRLRSSLQALAGETSRKGAILAALRESPLVGEKVEFRRERTTGRNVDL